MYENYSASPILGVSYTSIESLPVIVLLLVNLSPSLFFQNLGCVTAHLSSVCQIYEVLLKCHKSTTISHLALSSIAVYQRYMKKMRQGREMNR